MDGECMIGLVGLDYQRATSELRGRLSYAGGELERALRMLAAEPALDEVVILSTCNRTEFYVSSADWSEAAATVQRFVLAEARRPLTVGGSAESQSPGEAEESTDLLLDALTLRDASSAMRHLLRVASGLESTVVGEAQILGQVKDALAAAEVAETAGEDLRGLFGAAIRTGKRARAETDLGRADVSVASVAVSAAREELGTLVGRRALVIGAGRTSRLCAELLSSEGVASLLLANRTPGIAAQLAQDVAGEAIALDEAPSRICDVDLVVAATAAPYAVLSATAVAAAMRGRSTPLIICDLSVPPDVEPSAGDINGVMLHTIDTLRLRPEAAHEAELRGRALLEQVEEVVEDGLRDHLRQRTMRLAVPGIAALRRHVDRSEEAEVARALADLEHLSEHDRQIIERFGRRLVDKMFHHLVSRIRSLAEYDEVPPDVTMRVLSRLFADPDASAAARERDEQP